MPRQRNVDPEKHCERCGIRLHRKRYGKNLEDFTAFRKRKFCSLTCANSTGALTTAGHRARSRKLRGSSCEACGYTLDLHAHHKDGNIANNAPENIQTLCTYCHNFWHALLDRLLKPSLPMPRLFGSSGME
jgi:hypothetical protein